MRKLIHGVAYNSKGNYLSFIDGRYTAAYGTWYNMINRCYSPKQQIKQPTYIGCSVSEEWLDFQVFAHWFTNHPHGDLGYHLDKDILIPNNKVYGPAACCFVPVELNSLLTNNNVNRGVYPQGVFLDRGKNKLRVSLSTHGKQKHLGYFDDMQEAYQVYKTAKERHVKNMALKWANKIQWEVFVALMNWELPDVKT